MTMGSKSSPSASVCSHSPDAVPIDNSVHQVFFKCRPPSLRWMTSSSATTTRGPWHGLIGWSSRWHPDDMACHPKLKQGEVANFGIQCIYFNLRPIGHAVYKVYFPFKAVTVSHCILYLRLRDGSVSNSERLVQRLVGIHHFLTSILQRLHGNITITAAANIYLAIH